MHLTDELVVMCCIVKLADARNHEQFLASALDWCHTDLKLDLPKCGIVCLIVEEGRDPSFQHVPSSRFFEKGSGVRPKTTLYSELLREN